MSDFKPVWEQLMTTFEGDEKQCFLTIYGAIKAGKNDPELVERAIIRIANNSPSTTVTGAMGTSGANTAKATWISEYSDNIERDARQLYYNDTSAYKGKLDGPFKFVLRIGGGRKKRLRSNRLYKKRRNTKRRNTKRKNTKRRNTKRKNTKRRNTKRRV
jgi:hypothetical protein